MNHVMEFHTTHILSQDLVLKKNVRNVHQLPRLTKVVIHTGTKAILEDKRAIIPNLLANELVLGQKARQIQSKMAVASFYLQKGHWIGWKTTLRHEKLDSFLHLLITTILPSDDFFEGFAESNIDQGGNLQFGIPSFIVCSELDYHYEGFQWIQGSNISIGSTANTRSEAKLLFSGYQFPFESSSSPKGSFHG